MHPLRRGYYRALLIFTKVFALMFGLTASLILVLAVRSVIFRAGLYEWWAIPILGVAILLAVGLWKGAGVGLRWLSS